jgi:hypothetical protein
LQAAAQQVPEEGRREEQAHLLVVERQAVQHAASDAVAQRYDRRRRRSEPQADAVVLEVRVVDEQRCWLQRDGRQQEELLGAAGASAEGEDAGQRCGEEDCGSGAPGRARWSAACPRGR